jgi:hypothetical protein
MLRQRILNLTLKWWKCRCRPDQQRSAQRPFPEEAEQSASGPGTHRQHSLRQPESEGQAPVPPRRVCPAAPHQQGGHAAQRSGKGRQFDTWLDKS